MNEQQLLQLADKVYWVDSNKSKKEYTPLEEKIYYFDKDNPNLGQFQVLKVEDNVENGMQAMAIAPVINGKVDTSQIVIAYAGTNMWDGNDLETDLHSIGFGNISASLKGSAHNPETLKIVDTQPKTALEFAENIRKQYRNSKIITTGHSLGESLAMYVALKNGWDNIGFNGPDISNMISKSEIEYMKANPKQFRNFRNSYDYIGGIVGNTTNSAIHLHYGWGLYTHGLSDWKTNSEGQIVYPDGTVAVPSLSNWIDINQDGAQDIQLNGIDIRPRNLFTSDEYIASAKQIILDVSILNILATNLKKRIQEDILEMVKITQLCIEKNQKISKEFESRKKQVSESIKDIFKQSGIGFLLYDLNHSVGTIINKKYLLEQDRNIRLNHPFTMHQTPIIDGVVGNTWMYQQKLQLFHTACDNLLSQVYREKNPTFLYFFGGEPTILSSWSIIEKAAQQLLKESDYLFEGEGLRLGKKDGISDSLVVVLDIILKNTKELLKSMMSAVEFIQGIATHFEQADQWLGQQLQDGKFVGEIPSPIVPPNYKAYLEQDDILDDVKDVLQAFDKQVEENSRKYAQKVVRIFGEAFGQFETGLQQWIDRGGILKSAIRIIQHSYGIDVHVQEEKIKTTEIGDRYTEVETNYWGKLEALYPRHTRDTIHQIHTTIVPTFDQIQQAIWQCDKIKGNLQYLEPQLKPVVEQGVYKAFDLDEIVQGQQTLLKLARRLSREIEHVAQVMTGEGMASKSIELLQHKLQDTLQLLNYYSQFVSDCFGDNEHSIPMNSYSYSDKFRLN